MPHLPTVVILPAMLASMTPSEATLLLTGSLLLIAWELNRPGSILPGALGVLGSLLAANATLRYPIRFSFIGLLFVCVAVLGSNLLWRLSWYLLFGATAGLALSLHGLVRGALAVPWSEAIACGALLGGAGSVLSRIALRARRAKQVN